MNLYDTKVVICANCKKCIGEVDFDVIVIHPLCGQCTNQLPEGDDIPYTASHYQNKSLKIPI